MRGREIHLRLVDLPCHVAVIMAWITAEAKGVLVCGFFFGGGFWNFGRFLSLFCLLCPFALVPFSPSYFSVLVLWFLIRGLEFENHFDFNLLFLVQLIADAHVCSYLGFLLIG